MFVVNAEAAKPQYFYEQSESLLPLDIHRNLIKPIDPRLGLNVFNTVITVCIEQITDHRKKTADHRGLQQ